MDQIGQTLSAWDGVPLAVTEWRDGDSLPPLLCLPGLVRTAGDFARFAADFGDRVTVNRAVGGDAILCETDKAHEPDLPWP